LLILKTCSQTMFHINKEVIKRGLPEKSS